MDYPLIRQGEAPLASGDEMTPSLEYTLDEPNPLHADDLEPDEPRQPSPGSGDGPGGGAGGSPPETPSPPGEHEGSTPEGDNTVTLERQPIYAQVVKKADREPKDDKPEEKEKLTQDDDEKKQPTDEEAEGPDKAKDKKKKKKDKKKDKEKSPSKTENKAPKPKKVQVRRPYPRPAHRTRCVTCGCPRCCCSEYCFFPWCLFFLLLQAGPLAVLVLDFLAVDSHGFTIERYIAEWHMEPAVCRVSSFYVKDFSSCKCGVEDYYCEDTITEYGCVQVEVDVFTYNHSGPLANTTRLWRSERELVLNKYKPKCFNLDICKIDPKAPWYAYRNATNHNRRLLQEKFDENEGFVCYYRPGSSGEGSFIHGRSMRYAQSAAVLEMETTIWDALLWCFLPLLGVALCWIIICACLCWYCCPCAKYETRIRDSPGGGYQEVEKADPADPEAQDSHSGGDPADYDPNAMKEALHYGGDSEFMQAGKWPTSGPAAACDM